MSAAFSWLETERAFHNPDLGSPSDLDPTAADIRASVINAADPHPPAGRFWSDDRFGDWEDKIRNLITLPLQISPVAVVR